MPTDRDNQPVVPGDVVQINKYSDEVFGGCFLVVEKTRPWGVQGYVQTPSNEGETLAYYRAGNGKFKKIGRAEWLSDTFVADPGSGG